MAIAARAASAAVVRFFIILFVVFSFVMAAARAHTIAAMFV
jgi:hypothetical protein